MCSSGTGGLVSVAAIVEATGLNEVTIRHHLDAGEWPGVRVGKRRVWRVPRAVLIALLDGRDPASLKRPDSAA